MNEMNEMNETDPKILEIYNQLKVWIDGSKKLDSSSLVILTTQIISLVEKVAKDESGSMKKEIAMTVIHLIIKDSKIDDDAKASLNLLVDGMVSPMIDTMISIANKEIILFKEKGCLCF